MAGDDELPTLAALYLRNRDAMLRAARAILRNQHDAEDAVSAAVVKIAARIAEGHVPDNPDAYLVQSARNAALDRLRTSARQQQDRSADLPVHPNGQAPMKGPREFTDIAENAPDIVDQIIERDRSREIRAVVQRTLGRLAEREASMLSLLLTGHTRIEIGIAHSITGQRVGQLLKEPIADLLDELGVEHTKPRARRTAGE